MGTRTHSLADLTPDPQNANKGTPRGAQMVEDSLRQYGAGRSILVDKHGVVIAGNKTLEAAASIGLDDVLVVQTDGRRLVVVQRTDLDLATDAAAKELGIVDNRASETGLAWDAPVLQSLADAGADLSKFFTADELAAVLARVDVVDAPVLPTGDGGEFEQITFTLHRDQAITVRAAVDAAKQSGHNHSALNENSNGNALAAVCEAYRG